MGKFDKARKVLKWKIRVPLVDITIYDPLSGFKYIAHCLFPYFGPDFGYHLHTRDCSVTVWPRPFLQ